MNGDMHLIRMGKSIHLDLVNGISWSDKKAPVMYNFPNKKNLHNKSEKS